MGQYRPRHFGKAPKRCRCLLNHMHDSREESAYCNTLWAMMKAGEIKSFEVHVTFRLDIGGVHIMNHRPDFLVTRNDGTVEVHEYKGLMTDKWRIQRALWRVCDATKEIEYRVVGRRDIAQCFL